VSNKVTLGGFDHGDEPPPIVVNLRAAPAKERKLFRLPLSPEVSFGVHDNCLVNMFRGVVERVFLVETPEGTFESPPSPEHGRWHEMGEVVEKLFCASRLRSTAIPPEEFVGLYSGRKRTVYENARRSLVFAPVSEFDSFVTGFVKCEKINFTVKPDPAPRIIYPRDPRYNLAVGVYLKPIEHRVYHMIDRMFEELGCHPNTVAKGHNFSKRARVLREKWERFANPVALLFDAKRFDQHVSVEALQFEHSVYNKIFQQDETLQWLLRMQLTLHFFGRCADGSVVFTKRGGRCSGDMNTAMGNVLIMSCLFYKLLSSLGIKFEFYDDGDDSVLIVERRDVVGAANAVPDFFLAHGFNMKMGAPQDVFERIEFCQTQPVWDGERWTMVRDPRVALAKDSVSTLPCDTPLILRRWLQAVSECGEAIAGGLPVWNTFYQRYRMLAAGAKAGRFPDLESGMFILSKGMRRRFRLPTVESRVSFFRAFGIEPYHQELMERHFENIPVDLSHVEQGEDPFSLGYLRGCRGVLVC